MRPFGCHVTILNTLDHLGKFDGKAYEGFFVGYFMNSKAFRVYNIRTRRVEENLHIKFLENKHIVAGDGPEWLFDIDMLTKSMNYVPVVAGTNSNDFAGTKDSIGAGQSSMETGSTQDYIFMPLWKDGSPLFDSSPKNSDDAGSPPSGDAGKKHDEVSDKESGASNELNSAFENLNTEYPDDPKMPGLETIETYGDSKEEADFNIYWSLSIHLGLRTLQSLVLPNYTLWDIIENENSFKPEAKTTEVEGTTTTIMSGPVSADEKLQKRNDVKARSMLLMTLPSEHLLTFNQYKDAQTMFAAIQARFGSNEATNKTRKTLLKQMYENFNAPSTESLDSILNRLQKIINLKQIHEDELEEMDLKWQLALLSIRARRFFQKTSKKITINPNDTAGYDKSKVECYNYHKTCHFARECRGPRNHDSSNRNQDNSRRTVKVEDTSFKAMLAIDGVGFDWSFMADDEVPTDIALMALLNSELNKSKSDLANYKRGLASVEERLDFFKKNESQIPENSKKGLGYENYNAVPPPPTGLFAPPKIDLSNTGLEEFKEPKFEGYGPKASKNVNTGAPIIVDWD
ncbi:hypothetical protein Tco_1223970, partial [Tanacetum coccineum]